MSEWGRMGAVSWGFVCRYALEVAGIRHFGPEEIAPVGRLAFGDTGPALLAPGLEEIRNAMRLAELLERLRGRVGRPVVVTSWYRDPEYNRAVGGARDSLHLTGGAADVKVRGVSPRDVARLVYEDEWGQETGVGVYPTFTHLDIRGLLRREAPARW